MGTSWEENKELEIIPFGRVLDRLWTLGSRVLQFFPSEAPLCHSNHYHVPEDPELASGGAEHMLTLFDANLSGFGYQEEDEGLRWYPDGTEL